MKYIIILFLLLFFNHEKIISQILIYGDTRTNERVHKNVLKTMLSHNPTDIFNTGDLVFCKNSSKNWNSFIETTSEARSKANYYPIIGNHEKNSTKYFEIFKLPENEEWYTITISNIAFIVLNSNKDIKQGSEQYNWLEKQLSVSQKENAFTIVLFHHPPFSSGTHRKDPKKARKSLIPLFEKYGVDAVFSGHVHMYERLHINGIYYFVTGGGGAPLHDVGDRSPYSQKILKIYHFCQLTLIDGKLQVEAFDIDNNLLEKIQISPKP